MIGIRNSEIRSYQTCQRRYYYEYIKEMESPPSKALNIGRIVHAGLAAYYGGGDVDQCMEEAAGTLETEEQQSELLVCQGIVHGYIQHYNDKHAPEKQDVLHVEYRFLMPLDRKYALTGTVDMICEDAQGRLWIWEHKTTGDLRGDFLDRAHYDWQIQGYAWAIGAVLKKPVAGVVYNVIRKPTIRQTLKETGDAYARRVSQDYAKRPSWYLMRETIKLTEQGRQEYLDQLSTIFTDMGVKVHECCQHPWHSVWLQNTGACLNFNTQCPYMRVCSVQGKARDTATAAYIRIPREEPANGHKTLRQIHDERQAKDE